MADAPKTLADRFSDLLTGSRDLALALGVMCILLMLIMPLPGWLLDMGLAVSITISVLILMTALFIEKPLQLSSFPTILLIATMLRLALNLASTRLILTNGHEGTHAAGSIIEAFGSFLMGGSAIIGITIFLMLILINFVVITKGSGRIAEVAARFSLDAMPGKQMAIDADLSAGLIDENTARARRKEIEDESTFYGSMDGAAKFVKGDAIACLILTAVNIIVGLIMGIVVHDVAAGEAFRTYTVLTIGDGLVSQIPALIVSTAAGLMVTKSGVAGRTDQALFGQLTRYPVRPVRHSGRAVRLWRLVAHQKQRRQRGGGGCRSARAGTGLRNGSGRADFRSARYGPDPNRTGLCALEPGERRQRL
jgi:flagellar biosynthesis protein FlhA